MVAKGLEALSAVMMKMISLIMYYAPIGLGAYFAALIGEFGPQLLGSYAKSDDYLLSALRCVFLCRICRILLFCRGKAGHQEVF